MKIKDEQMRQALKTLNESLDRIEDLLLPHAAYSPEREWIQQDIINARESLRIINEYVERNEKKYV